MRRDGVRGVLPLRPLLPAELLDMPVVLFRARALPLALIAAPLLAGEQVMLWLAGAPWLDVGAPFTVWWRVIATLFACDAVIVWLLGAYTGAAVLPALLGEEVTHRALSRRTRPLPVLVTAIVPGVLAWPAAYYGFVGWLVVHGLLGLSGVVVVLDRARWPFGALGRSVVLATRLGGRGLGIRLWGYGLWFGVRVVLAIGPIALLWQLGLVAGGYLGDWPVLLVWGLAGTVSCAALACLDAVLVADTRIRTEGLDIGLRRALANGVDPDRAAGHTRPRGFAPVPIGARPGVPPWPSALVRPSVPAGLSRQAQLQWMQAQAQARHRAELEQGREP